MTSAYAADPVFEAHAQQISYLLQRVEGKQLALPDFQRDFVWDTNQTLRLLRSIMSRFPAGTLLTWKLSELNSGFASRAVAGAPALNGHAPEELILDGQQRVTCLYRALSGVSDDRYFVRMRAFLRPDGSLKQTHEVDFESAKDAALFAIDTTARNGQDPDDREWQYREAAFPLSQLEKLDRWIDSCARATTNNREEEDQLKERLWLVRDAYLVPLRGYGFPVVTLPGSTPLEAVCNIFETLNNTGKTLGAFDLLTARFYPAQVNLRDYWHDARDEYDVLDEFAIEPYDLLQAISLRANGTAQRSDVLRKLTADDVRKHWQSVTAGMAGVIDLLRSEYGVLTKRWLPYGMLLVPMAAVYPELRAMKGLARAGALERLAQYFWCTTFMANFDQGANSQAGADHALLKNWLQGEGLVAPEAVANFNLRDSALLGATIRRKALHAGVMALTIRSGAKDFHSGRKLTAPKLVERKIDSHHIFPKAYLANSNSKFSPELILNRALIDSDTNKVIGKKAPSVYLSAMRDAHGPEKLADVLDSHSIKCGINSGLENDNYDQFLPERLDAVVSAIEEVTKSVVLRDNDLKL
ncbi:GmrSD restriction endonuclease domain-containing protein [Melissospora conviva]|uniref:GmrSD restriction endonuclease domain-containing protein n=1 Tax=Melissospora conviva TaxID=3388432 RepID=UPI003B7AC08A